MPPKKTSPLGVRNAVSGQPPCWVRVWTARWYRASTSGRSSRSTLMQTKFWFRKRGELGILVGLAVHDMAPVAPDRADVEQHRLVGGLGRRERLGAPGIPVNRLMGGRLEIGGAGSARRLVDMRGS